MTARVIPVNEHDEVLLLLGRDPARPGSRYWFTIGGGLEPGEVLTAGAVRELHEETGLVVAESDLGEPFHDGIHEFGYDGQRYRSESTFYAVRVPASAPISLDHLEEGEVGNVLEACWHAVEDVRTLPLSNDQLPLVVSLAVQSLAP